MGYVRIPDNWKKYIDHRGCSFSIQSILENGLILGGHESDKGRQTVFFTPLNPFGGDSVEEEPRDDHTIPQKVHFHSRWRRKQNAVYWVKMSRAQDQGLQFWQTKSYAIIAHKIASTKLFLKTEIEYCSKDSRLHDLCQKSHSKNKWR